MRLTKKQQKELIVWGYFVLRDKCAWGERSDEELEKFFEWSERGMHKDTIGRYGSMSYADKLYWGKVWAGRHAHEMYEPGILDGSTPYCAFIDSDTPREVVDFLEKEMFKGIDADIIEQFYTGLKETV